jgi:hypothetical protein
VQPTLPPIPKSFGAIRNVFSSALDAVLGNPNDLGYRPRSKVVVVLVDGLGADQLKERSGHAPWLNSQMNTGRIVYCAYPATTSANIGSFATGKLPGEHGLIGHQVWDRHHDERINLLVGWNERTDPLVWQPHETIAERAVAAGISANVIAAAEYRDTPYTKATMRGAEFMASESIADRFEQARKVVAQANRSISYLYIPELDKYGHKHGWRSPGWAALLEEVESQVKRFAERLPVDTGLVLTSDHGMVETQKDRQLVLDDTLSGLGLEFFGGDTRSSYLYFDSETAIDEALSRLNSLSYALSAHRAKDLMAAGWYGEAGEQALNRMPELVLQARSNFTLYHTGFSKQRAFDMISHHGSISPAEMRIPLIRVGI